MFCVLAANQPHRTLELSPLAGILDLQGNFKHCCVFNLATSHACSVFDNKVKSWGGVLTASLVWGHALTSLRAELLISKACHPGEQVNKVFPSIDLHSAKQTLTNDLNMTKLKIS